MIELKNINKIYTLGKNNQVVALKNINLKIEKGKLVVLRGSSGSGKSTILSLISALHKPTSGEVVVDGKKISKLPDDFASMYRRNNIGIVFQKYNLIPSLSVKENILLPLVPLNLDKKIVEEKLQKVMEQFQIIHKQDMIVKNLSGGEQQRVAIARANVNNPKIIIADEPTANLDKKLSLDFINILKEMKQDDKTIIVATHDPLFFDLDFVDDEIVMRDGEIVL
ncbi:ABC-TYPE TRANSPORTER, ATPASE COMPONENT [hydrothermal vent metagenome]|uniref:ABC-TYPE TRANSPORTER, ATPASE COMPONENT n=1 Tax=hydrothermal vent metagenome TaxID=652676 RepID=A0A1W1D2Q1_9ZZZZ